MSSDHSHDSNSDNGHGHDDHGHGHDDHGHGHDAHAPAGDVIPESSMQDMLLKLVTMVAAVCLIGMGFWWGTSPLPEGHQGHESQESHGQTHEPEQGAEGHH